MQSNKYVTWNAIMIRYFICIDTFCLDPLPRHIYLNAKSKKSDNPPLHAYIIYEWPLSNWHTCHVSLPALTRVMVGSTTIRLRTFHLRHFVYDISSMTLRLQTFCLLLYTRVQDSYTSNFCFSKSLFSSIPTSTYTMIPFINPTSTDTMIIQHI